MGLINALLFKNKRTGDKSQSANFSKVSDAINGLANQMRENTELEVESKNRVDITLAEYKHLTREIELLKTSNREYEMWLNKIGLTADVYKNVDPDSIRLWQTEDIAFGGHRMRYSLTWNSVFY